MTLQQLRYFVAVAEHGSFNAASSELYTSQSNLSTAVHDLERELGVEVFNRSNRGVTLTSDGVELIGYARQVLEQVEMLESRYPKRSAPLPRLAVSAQHYAFSVRAFLDVAETFDDSAYAFTMRETSTREIINDVASFRSDLGILYTSDFNRRVLEKAFDDASLTFTPVFEAAVHVFVGEGHPLAQRDVIRLEDLDPYPRYTFDQGTVNSFYYAEEPLAQLPHRCTVAISDRATLTSLLTESNGYTLSTGVLTHEMQARISAIRLEGDETMRVGYLTHKDRLQSELVVRYIERLREIVGAEPSVRLCA